jgi:hypothetical protein
MPIARAGSNSNSMAAGILLNREKAEPVAARSP